MPLTIGLAGMDPATETALQAAFLEANQRLGERWELLPETRADHIVVDMDSMYGPMSWLRLHASGKRVVGLTSASRAQTDFRLGRPFSVDSLTTLLEEIAAQADAPPAPEQAAAETPPAAAPASVADTAPAAVAAPAVSVAQSDLRHVPPFRLGSLTTRLGEIAAQADAPPAQEPAAAETPPPAAPASVADTSPAAVAAPPAESPSMPAAPPAEAVPAPTAPAVQAPEPATLFGHLASGRLAGHLRYRRPSGPTLLVDADARTYHGPAALKPLLPYFEGELADGALEPLDA